MTAVSRRPFGEMPDGEPVEAITLTNARGISATVLSYGATLQAFVGPGRDGAMADVVLGYSDLKGYLSARNYFGATVGRVANRIAGGSFELDGRQHRLACNDGHVHLHGGYTGFDCAVWHIADITDLPCPAVRLTHVSADGDEGYPGRLAVEAAYSLDDDGRLRIAYSATTDRPTIVNLTNHALFDAAGEGSVQGALGNVLTLAADAYLPVDANLVPIGLPQGVANTPFDFREPRVISERITDVDKQLAIASGYDHNMVLNGPSGATPRFAARLQDPESGRAIELYTDQPGVQLYSGNFLDGSIRGKRGSLYRRGAGVALEAQHFPNAPNRHDFASIRLDPGQVYRSTTILAFALCGLNWL